MPSENEESGKFCNFITDGKRFLKKRKRYFLLTFCFIIVVLLLIIIPYKQVDYQNVSDNKDRATLENQYRATLAQILGGAAIGISLYYTWKRIGINEEELKTSKEGQINERFTRAIDQLGSDKMEIRLGGIYALESISQGSKTHYWPIMEILTAYVRKNSSAEIIENKKDTHLSMDIQANESPLSNVPEGKGISLDIQIVLTVIGRRDFSDNEEPASLDLSKTCLKGATLAKANLAYANLYQANLEGANLIEANLEVTYLRQANLEGAYLLNANLEGTKSLIIDQLLKVKTLYGTTLDEGLRIQLEKEKPELFNEPDY